MNHRMTPSMLYIRHRAQQVSDREWKEMLDDLGEYLSSNKVLRTLVKTDNAGPNPKQRNALNELMLLKGASSRTAVMSTSILVRGIVTALSWMRTQDIRSFGDEDYAGALRFLDVPGVELATVIRTIAEIERTVA